MTLTASAAAASEESATETVEVLVVTNGKFIETTWENYNNGSYVDSSYTESTTLSDTLDMDIIFVGDNEENPVTIDGSLNLGEHKITVPIAWTPRAVRPRQRYRMCRPETPRVMP